MPNPESGQPSEPNLPSNPAHQDPGIDLVNDNLQHEHVSAKPLDQISLVYHGLGGAVARVKQRRQAKRIRKDEAVTDYQPASNDLSDGAKTKRVSIREALKDQRMSKRADKNKRMQALATLHYGIHGTEESRPKNRTRRERRRAVLREHLAVVALKKLPSEGKAAILAIQSAPLDLGETGRSHIKTSPAKHREKYAQASARAERHDRARMELKGALGENAIQYTQESDSAPVTQLSRDEQLVANAIQTLRETGKSDAEIKWLLNKQYRPGREDGGSPEKYDYVVRQLGSMSESELEEQAKQHSPEKKSKHTKEPRDPVEITLRYISGEYRRDEPGTQFPTMSAESIAGALVKHMGLVPQLARELGLKSRGLDPASYNELQKRALQQVQPAAEEIFHTLIRDRLIEANYTAGIGHKVIATSAELSDKIEQLHPKPEVAVEAKEDRSEVAQKLSNYETINLETIALQFAVDDTNAAELADQLQKAGMLGEYNAETQLYPVLVESEDTDDSEDSE